MSSEPVILLTNDDGFDAPGLIALAEGLSTLGRIIVCAPDRPRSAASHSITLHKPLRIRQVGVDWHAASGTPADCVFLAVNQLYRDLQPDLLVSGINSGTNLGSDVLYSGTIAGAMEGTLRGFPSLAVSQVVDADSYGETRFDAGRDYANSARLAARLASEILDRGLPDGIMLNLNVPIDHDPDKGFRVARLGRPLYDQAVPRRVDPRGKPYYWIGGGHNGFADIPNTDCVALSKGYATITPIKADLTSEEAIKGIRSWNINEKQ